MYSFPKISKQSVKKNWFFWKLLVIICTKAKLYTNRVPEHKRGRDTKAMQQLDETTANLCFKRVSTSPFVVALAFDVSVAMDAFAAVDDFIVTLTDVIVCDGGGDVEAKM